MRISKFHYPRNYWIKGPDGWYSRERTADEKKMAKELIANLCMIPLSDVTWKDNVVTAIRP